MLLVGGVLSRSLVSFGSTLSFYSDLPVFHCYLCKFTHTPLVYVDNSIHYTLPFSFPFPFFFFFPFLSLSLSFYFFFYFFFHFIPSHFYFRLQFSLLSIFPTFPLKSMKLLERYCFTLLYLFPMMNEKQKYTKKGNYTKKWNRIKDKNGQSTNTENFFFREFLYFQFLFTFI